MDYCTWRVVLAALALAISLINAQSTTDYYSTVSEGYQTSSSPPWDPPSPSTSSDPWYYTISTPEPTYTPPVRDQECGTCQNTQDIWLEIVFAVDASSAMTSKGFDNALNTLISSLYHLNISQYAAWNTRVGFVFYSDYATIHADLGTYGSIDDIDNDFWNTTAYFQNRPGTNIENATQAAVRIFSTGRPNVRKVLVIMASSYDPNGYKDPTPVTDQFKNDGNIIICLEFVQTHGLTVPFLRNLSSPGYFLSNSYQDFTIDQLLQLYCFANCFCSNNYAPYGQVGLIQVPNKGCYFPNTGVTAETRAEASCASALYNKGYLAIIEDINKANYIDGLFSHHAQYWIGLKRNCSSCGWYWPDGSPLDWNNAWWAPNEPSSNGNCVMSTILNGFQVRWWTKDCRMDDYMYPCQAKPCSASKYCDSVKFTRD